MNPHIEIVVSPDGSTKIETKGIAGSSCRQASEFLEQALGSRESESLTAEYHATQTGITNTHQQHKEG